MHERLIRSLLDIPRSGPALPSVPPELLTVLGKSADLLNDPRVRGLQLERTNPVGEWQITAAMAFEALDGTPRPFKPQPHPPRHVSGSTFTDGRKEHRRRDQG